MKQSTRCPYPWSSLTVNHNSEVSPCCWYPSIAHISDVEIWNNERMVSLRDKWNKHNLKGTPCSRCEGLKWFGNFDYPINKDGLNFQEYHEGKTYLVSKPVEIQYVPSTSCNLECIHCFQSKGSSSISANDLVNFHCSLGIEATKIWFSGGEPFCIPQTFLLSDILDRPKVEAIFCTNGLLAKKMFSRVEGFKKYTFLISIASFNKDRYEHIHRGASFVELLRCLDFLRRLKTAGIPLTITRQMVLMKSNFEDLENISETSKMYDIDEVWVKPVHKAYEKRNALRNENIFLFPSLLSVIPNWKDIIEYAASDSQVSVLTHRNLLRIKSLLPNNALDSYLQTGYNLVRSVLCV